jgi:ribose/xylose/arabinose/galactoside ABC-type transport system permease subunit
VQSRSLFARNPHSAEFAARVAFMDMLDAITAAVVGGTALVGGYGNVIGTFVGALFIVCLNVLLILEGVSYYVGQGWKGVIILFAVYLQNLGRRV